MNTSIRLETDSRVYTISMGVLLVTGWLVVLANPIGDISIFGHRSPQSAIASSTATPRPAPLIRQGTEYGRSRMVIAADRILLTDKNRPRVSQALSEPLNLQLSAFTAHQKRWRVLLEHGPRVPESHLVAVERYYRNYKRYNPVRTLRNDFDGRMDLVVEVIP